MLDSSISVQIKHFSHSYLERSQTDLGMWFLTSAFTIKLIQAFSEFCEFYLFYWVMLTCKYILPVPWWWLRWWRIRLRWRRPGVDPWAGKIPWRRGWQPTPVFLPGESPWTEEPGGLQSMGLQGVRDDWASNIFPFTFACSPNTYCVLGSVFLDHTDLLRKCLPENWRQWASLVAQTVKESARHAAGRVWSLGREDPLEEGMAALSSILAWRIPMDRGAWRATVHGVATSWARPSGHSTMILQTLFPVTSFWG